MKTFKELNKTLQEFKDEEVIAMFDLGNSQHKTRKFNIELTGEELSALMFDSLNQCFDLERSGRGDCPGFKHRKELNEKLVDMIISQVGNSNIGALRCYGLTSFKADLKNYAERAKKE